MNTFMRDVRKYAVFLGTYFAHRLISFGRWFEGIKDIIVAFLIVKRGKYSTSFLNSSFFFLIVVVLVAGPIITENNPFIGQIDGSTQGAQESVIAYSPEQFALATQFSIKPRDKVEKYGVSEGDTLETIATKFDISVNSIRWANNLENDTITPGQVLDIPPVTGIVHEVASGENVYTIAKEYKTDPQKIANFPFNEFADLDTFQLTPGQILYVPDGIVESEEIIIEQPSRATIAQIEGGAKGTSSFIWPASGLITQYPVWYHMALDIASNSAPPILAADSGVVSYSGCIAWGYGCHVIIDHGNGYQTLYAHLSSLYVSAGESVGQGQTLGVMGSTGRSTGPHLHFEIRSGGLLNPLNFLQ